MALQNHIINHTVLSRFPADKLTHTHTRKKTINVYFDFWPASTHTPIIWEQFFSIMRKSSCARNIRQLISMIPRKKCSDFTRICQPHNQYDDWSLLPIPHSLIQENNAKQSSKRPIVPMTRKWAHSFRHTDLYEEYLSWNAATVTLSEALVCDQ